MAILPPHATPAVPRIQPITDGTLTDAERARLLADPRCEDGVHSEYLSRRERDYCAFLRWRMDVGMVTE